MQLINGALACNVFWKVEGVVSIATGTTMRGTIFANNAAINMSIGDTLEGRALSTTGAVNVLGVLAYIPIGCGSPVLTGPAAPAMASAQCYALFSFNGPVSNAGITHITGDVGTNVGLTTGFNPLFVTGAIHPIPDGSTAQCAADLGIVYTYLNTLPNDIELLYPAQFGHNLVLTPHTYLLNGAVSINDYSVFKGTIVCNNGAILLKTGVMLDGRAFSTTGALGTTAITANMPAGCGGSTSPVITSQPVDQSACVGNPASFSVTATGTGLTYRWRKGILNISNGGNISGANSATLTFNPVTVSDAASNYNVVITGTYLPEVISSSVSLTANPVPVPSIGSTNNPCLGSVNNIYYTESGQNNYTWNVSAGIIVSGQGTPTINVTLTGIGSQTVSVNYANQYGCFAAVPGVYNIYVNPLPGTAGAISGAGLVCEGTAGIAYSTPPIQNAAFYTWTLPAGATLVTGVGTTNILVDFGTGAVSGNITVAGSSTCGNGVSTSFPVTIVDDAFTIIVYNLLGEKIVTLNDVKTSGGKVVSQIDLRPANSGIYFVVFINDHRRIIRKMFIAQSFEN